jgi:alanine dehydrogenase
MKIGLIKEIKNRENRVALTPDSVKVLAEREHQVHVEKDAGSGSGFLDKTYVNAGAKIVSVDAAWDTEMVVKVKEPLESEYRFLRNQILFTYLHLAGATKALTETLLSRKTTAVAYETVEDSHGRLPILAPMSAVAGNMATLMGSYYLAKFNNGKGVQLGTVLGRQHGKVVIIGDGVVARHAAKVAVSMGAKVIVIGKSSERAALLKKDISTELQFVISEPKSIARHVQDADLVVGAVLLRGAKAPYVVTESMVRRMQPGSVIVDVSIDQGGCVETSHPTSHSQPIFEQHGVIHYCVTNMPGAYPKTSTLALNSAALPYTLELADKGGIRALRENSALGKGLNTYQGYITYQPVAESLDLMMSYRAFSEID